MLHGKLKTNKQGGFTLVELMIVIVIVGILAAIAVPAYNDSMRKSRRSDAKAALTSIAARMEQYFMDNKSYTTDLTDLGYSSSPADSNDKFYQVKSEAGDCGDITVCFKLTAAPPADGVQQGDTDCNAMVLDSNGNQTPAACW